MRHSVLILCAFLSACMAASPEPVPQPTMQVAQQTGAFDGMFGLFRAQNGLEAVQRNGRLDAIATAHARDMQQNAFFAHEGSDGSTLRQRLQRGGYQACFGAENIGNGYPDDRTVFQGWQASDGHRGNMLRREAREYGLGQVGPYWVLVLAEPC